MNRTKPIVNMPLQERFQSSFVTTRRNELLFWLANAVIYPAYLIGVDQLLEHVVSRYAIDPVVRWGLFGLALVPMLIAFFTSTYWHMGFKSRGPLYFVSLATILAFAWQDVERTTVLYWGVMRGIVVLFIVQRIYSKRRSGFDWKEFGLLSLLLLTIWSLFETVLFPISFDWLVASSLRAVPLLLIIVGWYLVQHDFDRDSPSKSAETISSNIPQQRALQLMGKLFLLLLKGVLATLILLGLNGMLTVAVWGIVTRHLYWVLLLAPLISVALPPAYIYYWFVLRVWRTDYIIRLQQHKWLYKGLRTLALMMAIAIAATYADEPYKIASLTLATQLLATDPGLFFSRQRTHLRALLMSMRHDYIRGLVSPTLLPANWLDYWLYQTQRFLRRESLWVGTVCALVFGGIAIPTAILRFRPDTEITTLAGIGTTSSLLLGVLYLMFWFVRHRPKHIVLPFRPAKADKDDANLQALANLTTQHFVENLRHITLLLNMRQVENVSLRTDNELAVFVTSGQDQEFIEQIRTLGDIETSVVNLPLGSLLTVLMTSLAHTRVRGSVHRQADNNVVIWVEFTERDGRTIAVDTALIPENQASSIDESVLQQITRSLVVKLILKLGRDAHLASSWQSLKVFLDGLDAAYHRNWRHAIACYRQAVNMEESIRGNFGLGYYHLGAALVFQGELDEGVKYLQSAETNGPPLAETQYMLALAQFYQHRDSLHIARIHFEDIILRCKTALQLHPQFPEAHHLLGTVFYQRGKLRERELTRLPRANNIEESATPSSASYQLVNANQLSIKTKTPHIDPRPNDYAHDYANAQWHLARAIRQYDQITRRLPKDAVAQATVWDEQSRITQDRMSATHRLGDVLRSLEKYSEADSYYADMLAAFPGNLRTLIDRAKTYCLAKNWQRADEFIRGDIFNHEGAKWHKSTNLYMGWARLGGLAEEINEASILPNKIVQVYEGEPHHIAHQPLYGTVESYHLGKAVAHLDYALHQYPRYMLRWQQIDWLRDFQESVQILARKAHQRRPKHEKTPGHIDPSDNFDLYNQPLDPENDAYLSHLQHWLAWRIDSYLDSDDKSVSDYTLSLIVGSNQKTCITDYLSKQTEFCQAYCRLKQLRSWYACLLKAEDRESTSSNLRYPKTRLGLAERAARSLKRIEPLVEDLADPISTQEITFAERWAIDVYGELSLLSARLLIEVGAFDLAQQLAMNSANLVYKWTRRWDKKLFDPKHFTLTPQVQSYQIATLFAWAGYATMAASSDPATSMRHRSLSINVDESLRVAEEQVHQALEFVSHHPLAIFVQASLYFNRNLYRQAIDELNRVLTIIAPYDPHKYFSRADASEKENQQVEQFNKSRKKFYYRERVSGRLQIEGVVDQTRVHIALAECFGELNDFRSAIDQLHMAISFSSLNDMDARLFLLLAHYLNRAERFIEAETAVQEAYSRNQTLSPIGIPVSLNWEPLVWECVINTNLERYDISIERGERVYDDLNLRDFYARHERVVAHLSRFDSNLNRLLAQYMAEFKLLMTTSTQGHSSSEIDSGDESFSEKLEGLAKSAMNRKNIVGSLALNVSQPHSFNPISILGSQALSFLRKDVLVFLIQCCDIRNNLAFNYAETGIKLEEALRHAQFAVKGMTTIVAQTVGASVASVKQMVMILPEVDFDERLAQYYDTLAWVYYRRNKPGDLDRARALLETEALSRCHKLAVVYYHLSRILVTQMERAWQYTSAKTGTRADIHPVAAQELSHLLRYAFVTWRHAYRLDANRSLSSRLRLVRQKINEYRSYWDNLQLPHSNSD